ncbi:hypothetical protein F4813DRAFT_154849 [Daldinia decipiens]|uniref:uncharacterized protein n=1 Tax=Daldinia decipiens TaxID=326647 RepID=UPI0020C48A46|nr:uncharacterized protein F4813DRAFT_154849 [Daldinia decipiens]KAI1655819.1 hypothetical protein F4813DRAFT_154849 [Daldinia decipiens]
MASTAWPLWLQRLQSYLQLVAVVAAAAPIQAPLPGNLAQHQTSYREPRSCLPIYRLPLTLASNIFNTNRLTGRAILRKYQEGYEGLQRIL